MGRKSEANDSAKMETPSKSSKKDTSGSSTKKKKKPKTPKEDQNLSETLPATPADVGTADATASPLAPPPPAAAPPTTMDVSVHRLRNLEYRPKPILCMACTPLGKNASDYVALSRDNGSVELRSVDEKWRCVASVAGSQERPVDVLAWTCGNHNDKEVSSLLEGTAMDTTSSSSSHSITFASTFQESHTRHHSRRTLVGASREGTLFCVDFHSQRLTAVTTSGGGGVFSLTSLCSNECCSNSTSCAQLVAAGCQDGAVRIYRVVRDNGDSQLQLVSTLACAASPVLSLAWQQSNKAGAGMDGTVLYAGVADGTIRRHDCTLDCQENAATDSNSTAHWKSTLRMTVESQGRATPTRVWALQALQDGTVISADSLGHVQFWDGATGTLLKSFNQNDHKADVLCLAVSANECQVFASGVDSRVVCMERRPPPPTASSSSPPTQRQPWILTHAQRPHTHDVKALVIARLLDASGTVKSRDERPPIETLCSGGVDTKFCTYPIQNFGKVRPRNWYPWPDPSPVAVAKEARVVIIRRDDTVDVYRMASSEAVSQLQEQPLLLPQNDAPLGTLEIKGTSNLVCSDVSPDGALLAVSDSSTLMLFRLEYQDNRVVPSKLDIPMALRAPCVAVRFVSNGQLACATVDDALRILRIRQDDDKSDFEKSIEIVQEHQFDKQVTLNAHAFAIQCMQVSNDGKWLALLRGGLGSGAVQVYSMEHDNYRYWWSLPALEGPVSSIGFISSDNCEAKLAVACTNCAFYVFDVPKKQLSEWSEQAGFPVSPALPSELKYRSDFPVRFAFNPATPNKFLMGSFGAFAAINMEQTLPKHCRMFPEKHVRSKKRLREEAEAEPEPNATNCTICLRYNSMLYMDFIGKNELLVVEQPWLNVVSSFPAALERKVYGS